MLSLEEADLVQEIKAARKWRDRHLSQWPDLVGKMGGVGYRDADANAVEGENFALSYISLVLPRIAHDVPRVSVATDDPEQAVIADELEVALNQWAKRTRLRQTLAACATDMLLTYGVGMVSHEPDPNAKIDLGGAGYTPRIYRVPPQAFLIDPACDDTARARYMGHEFAMDYADLRERAESEDGWLMENVDSLTPASDLDRHRFVADDKREVPDRAEVMVTELWLPEAEGEGHRKGRHHGVIVTLAENADGASRLVREPRPYFGPPGGPYVLFGAYTVPGDAYPLGPMAAAFGLVEELDEHMRFVQRSAGQYRRLLLVNGSQTKLAQSIHSSPDRAVVPVEGELNPDSVREVELGGVTNEQLEWAAMSRDRLERLTGINEVIRGQVTGQATATEVQTANTSSGLRIEWIKRQFLDACDTLLSRVAWFMVTDKQVKVPLGHEGMRRFGERRTYRGGGIDFGQIDLEIDGYSVERTSDQMMQRRAIELLQMALQLAQAKAALGPAADWDRIADAIGEMLNIRDFGAYFRSAQQQQMGMPLAAPGVGQAPQTAGGSPGGLAAALQGMTSAGSPQGGARA